MRQSICIALALLFVGLYVEGFFAVGSPVWLVLAAIALVVGWYEHIPWLRNIRRRPPTPPRNQQPTAPSPPKAAHEIPGARAWDFALYQLACLLIGEETTWPLQSQKAREEFNSICRYADGVPGLGEEIGYASSENPARIIDYTEDSGTIYKVRITRVQARQYLHSQGSSIPEFLDERFDAACKPKGDTW